MASMEFPAGVERFAARTLAVDFTKHLDASVLKGKSILITGGANGIGLAFAQVIAPHGPLITIADLQQEAGETAAQDLTSKGYKVQFVHCDVTSYKSQLKAFQAAIKFGDGSLDVVVPSAGVIAQQNLFDMAAATEPTLDSAPPEPGLSGVDINLKGVYYSSFLALHYFRLPPAANATPFKKALVLIASAAGYTGYGHSTTYSVSKFGVRGLFYSIRDHGYEQSPQVRVNLVAPWFVRTAMTAEMTARLELVGFVAMEKVVDTMVQLSANESITGRSAVILPDDTFDAGDDFWDGYGGPVVQEHVAPIFKRAAETLARLQERKQSKRQQ